MGVLSVSNPATPFFLNSKNKIINADFAVAQRGITFNNPGQSYTIDMFRADSGNTVIRDTGFGDIPYSIKFSNTGTNPALRTNVELPVQGNAGQFSVGTTWTVSYYARRASGTGNAAIYMAFTDTGMGGAVTVVSQDNIGTVNTVWQRFKHTFTISATPSSTNTTLQVTPYTNTGATTVDTWIAGIQLEEGTSATNFTTATGHTGLEELLCKRYYHRDQNISNRCFSGFNNSTTAGYIYFNLPVQMRGAPAFSFSAASDWAVRTKGDANNTCSNLSVIGNDRGGIWLNATTTGLIAGEGNFLVALNLNSWLAVSAEL